MCWSRATIVQYGHPRAKKTPFWSSQFRDDLVKESQVWVPWRIVPGLKS